MTEADWNDCRNRFHRGIDWMVSRVGRHWQLAPCYHWPVVFKTKTAAYDAGSKFVCQRAAEIAATAQLR